MPETSEERAEAARASVDGAVRRPLLRIISSARTVSFSMNLQMSGFPQLPLARDIRSAERLEKSKTSVKFAFRNPKVKKQSQEAIRASQ